MNIAIRNINRYLKPTPLTYNKRLSNTYGCNVYLKREDLNHTGAHKINNALGQALLAKKMGIEKITAIDIDDICEENFYQNCILSNVSNIEIQILDVHSYDDYNHDIILANIDKNNIIKILDKYQNSKTSAIMILAGILNVDLDEILLKILKKKVNGFQL